MTDLFIKGIQFVRNLIMFVFPKIAPSQELLLNLDKYLDTFIDWLSFVNFLIPLSDIFLMMVIVLTIKISSFALFIINWIIRRVADFIP